MGTIRLDISYTLLEDIGWEQKINSIRGLLLPPGCMVDVQAEYNVGGAEGQGLIVFVTHPQFPTSLKLPTTVTIRSQEGIPQSWELQIPLDGGGTETLKFVSNRVQTVDDLLKGLGEDSTPVNFEERF